MPILPLPQFEADLADHLKDEADRVAYERLNAPKTLVVRFGYLKMVGEFPWQSNEKPGCGSKIVVRTHRGTEIGEMLTSTCPNSGCSKSVSRKEMLEYIENSGGRQYPFSTDGRALRIATPEDMELQTKVEQSKHALRTIAKRHAEEMMLPLKIVEAEPILGGERITVYFLSEDRVDFRDLVQRLQNEYGARVDMRQVGARDEARITADYERCGQYCCCKNFLKVLKPISMKSAKTQKATLDPLKISGRCGRLMCCLRYEDETYEDLRKRLPHRKARVGTPDGDGTVIDSQILTQLVLVRLDTGTDVAVPVENLTEPGLARAPEPPALAPARPAGRDRPRPGPRSEPRPPRSDRPDRPDRTSDRADRPPAAERPDRAPRPPRPAPRDDAINLDDLPGDDMPTGAGAPSGPTKKKRRRRKRKPGAEGAPADTGASSDQPDPSSDPPRPDAGPADAQGGSDSAPRKKRRRRKRKPGGPGSPGGPDSGPSDQGGPSED